MKQLLLLYLALGLLACQPAAPADQAPEPQWVPLFNGQDLSGWRVKIRGHALDDNYGHTFRVEDGVMKVAYDAYDDFAAQYGHIFYEKPFSSYHLRVEYRFTGEQAPGGEGWAWRNSGIMVHGQAPEGMLLDQDFPASIEVQLLGGPEEGERPTANLCTPGTHVVMADTLLTQHCLNSSSATYRGDQWVRVEVQVYADSLIRHIVEGDTVLTYTRPQIGGGNVNPVDPAVMQEGQLLRRGSISLQSESHPVEFRKVEILDLSGR